MSTQSNPVIFVSIGQGAEMWQFLSPALKDYSVSSAYVDFQAATFCEAIITDSIKSEIGRIWREFLQQGKNTADIVRVNYIMGTDEVGLMLPILRQHMEKLLSALYPAGILTDIFCILSDDKLLENEDNRKMIMAMLQSESSNGASVYLLSNLTSENELVTNDSIANTIAMLTLFKDFVPESYVTGADASRYNEFFFLDNCFARQGHFLTASSLNVTIPQEGLKALLMAELLAYGKNNMLSPSPEINIDDNFFSETNLAPASIQGMDYLLGMVIPQVDIVSQRTRQQWISQLFGTRLELLFDSNIETNDSTPSPLNLPTRSINFFDLLRYTDQGGLYETHAHNALECAKTNFTNADTRFRTWLNNMPVLTKNTPEAAKRRLSPLASQDMWPYVIANEYLHRKSSLRYLQDTIVVLNDRHRQVLSMHQHLLGLLEHVDNKIGEFVQTSQILDITFAPFSSNAASYFRELFYEFAEQNRDEIFHLSTGMTESVLQGDLTQHLTQLEDYIDNVILHSDQFNKPIMTTMRNLVATGGHSDIATALGEWVFNRRNWNIRLKTGYASLHTEINLFMPTQDAADVKHRFEERGLGRMNLFIDDNADRVAVLYHAGAFGLEDLFYESLYADTNDKTYTESQQ